MQICVSMMDHLTRFVVLIPLPSKAADTVAGAIGDRTVSVFGSPENLRSDQDTEFENRVIHQLRLS